MTDKQFTHTVVQLSQRADALAAVCHKLFNASCTLDLAHQVICEVAGDPSVPTDQAVKVGQMVLDAANAIRELRSVVGEEYELAYDQLQAARKEWSYGKMDPVTREWVHGEKWPGYE